MLRGAEQLACEGGSRTNAVTIVGLLAASLDQVTACDVRWGCCAWLGFRLAVVAPSLARHCHGSAIMPLVTSYGLKITAVLGKDPSTAQGLRCLTIMAADPSHQRDCGDFEGGGTPAKVGDVAVQNDERAYACTQ